MGKKEEEKKADTWDKKDASWDKKEGLKKDDAVEIWYEGKWHNGTIVWPGDKKHTVKVGREEYEMEADSVKKKGGEEKKADSWDKKEQSWDKKEQSWDKKEQSWDKKDEWAKK